MSAAPRLSPVHAVQCELAVEFLRRSQNLRLRATGRSMVPTIWPGDTLVIEPLRGNGVMPGEIVLFSRNGRFVAHRVIAESSASGKQQIRTQGDAVSVPDAPVACTDLIGKVLCVVRDGKAIEVSRNRSTTERAVSTLVGRSNIAARVVVGVHGMRRGLQPKASPEVRQQSSQARVSPCQN